MYIRAHWRISHCFRLLGPHENRAKSASECAPSIEICTSVQSCKKVRKKCAVNSLIYNRKTLFCTNVLFFSPYYAGEKNKYKNCFTWNTKNYKSTQYLRFSYERACAGAGGLPLPHRLRYGRRAPGQPYGCTLGPLIFPRGCRGRRISEIDYVNNSITEHLLIKSRYANFVPTLGA